MRNTRSHLAQTTDDHNHATGTLFLEDIIEELIGTIEEPSRN